ncbi:MAG: hypothetical protein JSR99_15680 [Proteobacteria bacterium]|nr:hypothetical protein [Pseudomonadota bacterium]
MIKFSAAKLCLLTGSLLAVAATNASAAAGGIECRQNYQIVNGQPISTPYCRDGYLAEVARQYGFKASAASLRNNPSRKAEICSYVGDDIRVQNTCAEVLPTPFGPR